MNVLIFDSPVSVAHVARSILLSRGHRAAVASDAEAAARMLTTSLFDVLIIGPGGAPEEFANFIQDEFPQLPIVLAGVPVAVPPGGQIAAVLPAPLSARKLVGAFIRLEREREARVRGIPVQIAGDGLAIACRLADLTPESMLLCGESDEFNRYFEASPARVDALVAGRPLSGQVVETDLDTGHVRLLRVAVKLEGESARDILAGLLKA
ncbi:MAG TPA: hypothetical protein VF950_21845 [Planctomycetota bacterium]